MCFRHFDVPTPFCKFENVGKNEVSFFATKWSCPSNFTFTSQIEFAFPRFESISCFLPESIFKNPPTKIDLFCVYPKAALRLFLCVDFVLRKMKRNDHTTCVVYKSQCTAAAPFSFQNRPPFLFREILKNPFASHNIIRPHVAKSKILFV